MREKVLSPIIERRDGYRKAAHGDSLVEVYFEMR